MANRDRRQAKHGRKGEARERRAQEIKRARRRATMRKAGWAAVAALVIAGIVIAFGQVGKKGQQVKDQLNVLAAEAGCSPLQVPPDDGRGHTEPPATIQYKTSPPTSGTHYSTTAPTGVQTAPIQNEYQVHNLEHGHIGIQYKGLDPALMTELEAIAKSDNKWIFMAPYPAMDTTLAFTAWDRLLTCSNPNDKVGNLAREFIRQFKNKAPESVAGSPA